MTLPIKPLSFKPPKLRGLPRPLVDQAFERDYGQSLQQHNATAKQIAALGDGASGAQALALFEARANNAVEISLFECFFGSLTDEDTGESSAQLSSAIENAFGNMSGLGTHLKTAAAGFESGWLTLVRHNAEGSLAVSWTSGSTGIAVDQTCLLAIPLDNNIRQPAFSNSVDEYIDAVMQDLKWSVLNSRFSGQHDNDEISDDVLCSPEALVNDVDSFQVIDVRLADDLQADDVQVAGSQWLDPQKVGEWADSIPDGQAVVVYCMYGAWVSQQAAEQLREHGVSARALAGGISSWRALSLPTQALDEKAASNT